ncbi:hypothetical protein niasHS_001008 [Heterodera schachtii]|uniref:Uncharacterized protein n=1 Tax=Heterodera schachtii TaxID=97005 RepID=A0ABD2K7Y5_HETSC
MSFCLLCTCTSFSPIFNLVSDFQNFAFRHLSSSLYFRCREGSRPAPCFISSQKVLISDQPMNTKKPSAINREALNESVSASPGQGSKSKDFRNCNDIKLATRKTNEWGKAQLKGCTKELCVRCFLDADMYYRTMHIYDGQLAKSRDACEQMAKAKAQLTEEVARHRRDRTELTTKYQQLEALLRHEEQGQQQQMDDILKERNIKMGELQAKVDELTGIIGQRDAKIAEMANQFALALSIKMEKAEQKPEVPEKDHLVPVKRRRSSEENYDDANAVPEAKRIGPTNHLDKENSKVTAQDNGRHRQLPSSVDDGAIANRSTPPRTTSKADEAAQWIIRGFWYKVLQNEAAILNGRIDAARLVQQFIDAYPLCQPHIAESLFQFSAAIFTEVQQTKALPPCPFK